MCGIIGYIGPKKVLPLLLSGLTRLEYRGYDSAGLAWFEDGACRRLRAVGKIQNLKDKVSPDCEIGGIGIAHTRWATHGGVTEANAHPHFGGDGNLALVHNGIIENYREIKAKLADRYMFSTETDSEVLAHLIDSKYRGNLKEAVIAALQEVRGTYGLALIHKNHPRTIIAARLGSPLVIGIGENEYFLASDPTPMLAYTKKVVFLDDGELAEITDSAFAISNIANQPVQKNVFEIDWDEKQAQKSGFAHFMIKEIFDQPTVFLDAIRGRVHEEDGTAVLGGLNMTVREMQSIDRVIFIACGTAYYASMVGKYAFESLAKIASDVDIASEFRYRDPVITPRTLVFAVSQSGETADTIAAVKEAKRKGAHVRGIVNVVGSTLTRETGGGTYIHAGPELAVASTKAYTNMIAIMLLYALQFGRMRHLSMNEGRALISGLLAIPELMKKVLDTSDVISAVAKKYKDYDHFLFLGKGMNYPVAQEGSLKLKEISYIHSEAYPAGEMKHGMNALLGPQMPVFAIMTKNSLYEKMRNSVEEVKARNSPVIVLASEGDAYAGEIAQDVIFVPKTHEMLEPLINTIVVQLFAYHAAVALGRDVDRPRNLAKSVTVE
ncbi:MAG: glutamine--fructose-6-phosphate transaminase (isomerizing) [Parcubacteria group bacterium]|nr:glutamine--fructose-6-phosphate transaminase (isomerizing) [Parcubacteria group bacterium]